MISCLATALHKLPREVETITISECEALFVYWERTPPPHVSLALLLSAQTTWEPKEREGQFKESSREELAEFAASVGLRPAAPK